MPLPRGDEYQAAVQNPRTAFVDVELQGCTVEKTPLGLPKPYAGGFTTTYRLHGKPQDWAVRCFTREVRDLQRRYEAIDRFLTRNVNGYFVRATCLQRGIQIGSQWHPIIKMEWVDGEPLNVFIEKNLNASTIKRLADEFVVLTRHLEKLGVAHGDLQHGNIVVKSGRLHLIDYDGMYLSELATLGTNEIGHINYQHPSRSASNYSATIDRFSAIVIYLGLVALSISPDLWRKYDNSENILFSRDDFADVENSVLVKELMSLAQIAPLVKRFKGVCWLSVDKVPTLDQFIVGNFSYSGFALPVTTYYPKRSQYPVVAASQTASLLEHIGDRVEVVGEISDWHSSITRYGQPYLFLNFGIYPAQTLTLVLWQSSLKAFERSGIDLESYVGKWVSVTGVVSHYKYKPQIIVEMPSQIQVLRGEEDAKTKLGQIVEAGQYSSVHSTPSSTRPGAVTAPQLTVSPPAIPSKSVSTTPSLAPKQEISKPEADILDSLYSKRHVKAKPPTASPSVKHPPSSTAVSKQEADILGKLYGQPTAKSSAGPIQTVHKAPQAPPQRIKRPPFNISWSAVLFIFVLLAVGVALVIGPLILSFLEQ